MLYFTDLGTERVKRGKSISISQEQGEEMESEYCCLEEYDFVLYVKKGGSLWNFAFI